MKNLFKTFVLSVFIIGLITACSSRPKQAEYIPKDSTLLFKINAQSLFTDNFFEFIGKSKQLEKLFEEFENVNSLDDIGIKQLTEFYGFASLLAENIKVGSIIPLSDPEKFEAFWLTLNELSIKEEGEFKFIEMSNQYTISWNNELAIFHYGNHEEGINPALQLLKKETDLYTGGVDAIEDFIRSKDHISIVIDQSKYLEMTNRLPKDVLFIGEELEQLYSDLYNNFGVNFNKGSIDFSSKIYNNEKYGQLLKAASKKNTIENLHPTATSPEPLAYLSASINMEVINEFFKIFPSVEEELENTLGGMFKIKEIFALFDGDLLVTYDGMEKSQQQLFSGYDENGEEIFINRDRDFPYLSLAIGLADHQKLLELFGPFLVSPLTGISKDKIITQNDEELHVILTEAIEARIFNGKFVVSTSNKGSDLIKNQQTKAGDTFKQNTTKYPTYLYVKADDLVNSLPLSGFDWVAEYFSTDFDEMYFFSNDVSKKQSTSGGKIIFKNKDQNSLFTLMNFVEKFARKIEDEQNKYRNLYQYQSQADEVLQEPYPEADYKEELEEAVEVEDEYNY